MRVTVTAKGPTLDTLTRDTIRAVRAANRRAGRKVERAGKQAIRKGAPVMFGGAKPLSSKTKLTASTTGFDIVFDPYTVGGWTIAEHGTRPHPIRPRSAKALHWSGDRYTMAVAHPGTAGRKSWTKALKRLDAAVDPLIEDIYAEAITGA